MIGSQAGAGLRPRLDRQLFMPPLLVAAGLLACYGVLQTLTASPNDSGVLNTSFLVSRLLGHLLLSGVSFAIVSAICLPLGVVIAGSRRPLRALVFLLANLGQAVPGIGILVLLYAFLGIGVTPTIIALVVYSALPILRNTMVGIRGVDPAAVEAARGMGMTRMQALRAVQLPLASPLIFAGLRTSLVLIIGTATLGTFIGGGGLGDVIDAGINISDRIVFVGAVMVAALALLADWALSLVERAVVPRSLGADGARRGSEAPV
ncbi:MAG: ABC transporter permease [Candidatus Dormiibacterota bacterium]